MESTTVINIILSTGYPKSGARASAISIKSIFLLKGKKHTIYHREKKHAKYGCDTIIIISVIGANKLL